MKSFFLRLAVFFLPLPALGGPALEPRVSQMEQQIQLLMQSLQELHETQYLVKKESQEQDELMKRQTTLVERVNKIEERLLALETAAHQAHYTAA